MRTKQNNKRKNRPKCQEKERNDRYDESKENKIKKEMKTKENRIVNNIKQS